MDTLSPSGLKVSIARVAKRHASINNRSKLQGWFRHVCRLFEQPATIVGVTRLGRFSNGFWETTTCNSLFMMRKPAAAVMAYILIGSTKIRALNPQFHF